MTNKIELSSAMVEALADLLDSDTLDRFLYQVDDMIGLVIDDAQDRNELGQNTLNRLVVLREMHSTFNAIIEARDSEN